MDLRFVMSSETVLSDPVLLRQIAQNLIINAIKYSTGPRVLVGLRHDGEGA
jgi:signal transduction histidine kinase